jgi:hypothetical protein
VEVVQRPDGRMLEVGGPPLLVDFPPPPSAPGARIVTMDIDDSGVDTRTVGSVLLTVGLAGVLSLTMFWLWVGPGRRSRGRAHFDDGPSAPAY